MSLLIAWISRDQQKASAAYIVADSRITSGGRKWDRGKKVFSCKTQPWIFGFCGSVLVPTQLIAQLTDAIDSGLVVDRDDSAHPQWEAVRQFLAEGLKGAAHLLTGTAPSQIFGIYRREPTGFEAGYYTINGTSISFTTVTNQQKQSAIIKVLGRGETSFNAVAKETRAKNSSINAARIFFASFCRTLRKDNEATIGGPPQLATLRTRGPGHLIPVLFDSDIYHQGIKTDVKRYTGECFDETLQRINPNTRQLAERAQRQPLR